MGADTKALRTRIKSVDSMLHLTKAMGLVASSKIRRANEAMLKGREYTQAVEAIMDLLLSCPECRKNPFTIARGERIRLIVIAGDRGLAGGYNANIFRFLRQYPQAEILPIGKRACNYFGQTAVSSEGFDASQAFALARSLCDAFLHEEYDRLGIVSTTYISAMTQQVGVQWIFPLIPRNLPISGAVFEPDESSILSAAIPEYLAGVLSSAVKESFACEVAARRMAMDSAGKNAKQMIGDLQLSYNRARQSSITQEITEIVAGSGM